MLGLFCSAAVLELGLRAFGHTVAKPRVERVFDPRYGEVPRDSWIFEFAIDPARHHAVDLRGQFIALEKPAAETRVLFVGDSATEGALVAPEDAYPRVFERIVRARSPRQQVRAINAGVWGMTTIDEYHLLRDKLLPLAPDVVVVGLFMANDINFNLVHRERRRAGGPPAWIDAARARSAFADALFLQVLRLGERRRGAPDDATVPRWMPVEMRLIDERGLRMANYPEGELATYLRRPSRLTERAFDVLRAVLRDFRALGDARGFVVRVLVIPSPSAVAGRLDIRAHPDILAELQARGVVLSRGDLDVGLPLRRVLAICEEIGIACIDPTARLRRLGATAFFPRDEHPTRAAHRALAESLAAQ
jgi:hypothetical protein